MKHPLRPLAALLLAAAFVALPASAAPGDDEPMDKIDAPGGKNKGPVKPLESKMTGPSQLLPEATDNGKPAAPGDATPILPPVETSKRLVTNTLVQFNRAVQTKSFTGFHIEMLSKPFADEYPADKLLETFNPFIAAGANLGGVENVEPEFDPAPVIEDKLLKLKGFIPTRPMRVFFDFDYAAEGGKWKVNAMTINLRGTPVPPPSAGGINADRPAGAPSDAELAKLVGETLLDLNTAVKSGNFAPMLAKASTPMKWQIKTPAKLKEAFGTFVENNTDISAISAAEPQFDGPPKLDGKQMTVSGHYRVLPLFVIFSIDYYREANQWKLLACNVNTISPAEFKRDAAVKGEPEPAAKEPEDGRVDPGPPTPAMKKKAADVKGLGGDEPAPGDAGGDDMKMKDEMKKK